MKFAISILAWLCASSLVSARSSPQYKIIPSEIANGLSKANFVSTIDGLDGPQLSSVNNSAFDWWYFDAVSSDLKSSFVIVFYTAATNAFPFLSGGNVTTTVGIDGTFPNGTTISTTLLASEAVISSIGASGTFEGAGAGWIAPAGYSEYLITINSPRADIFGTFVLRSRAPPHYPCGPDLPGQNMEVTPHIGWANAVPDATGDVDVVINGDRIAFTGGVGYHDKVFINMIPLFRVIYWILLHVISSSWS